MTSSTAPPPPAETTSRRRPSWLELAARSLISIAILGAAIAAFVAIGKGTPPPKKPATDAVPLVQVDQIVRHEGGIDFEVDGVVIPFREVEVPTEVAGKIEFKSDDCRVGHTVEKGELLVRIDPKDYELEVRRIGESVKQARANLNELEVEITARDRQISLAEEDLQIKRREVDRYEKIDDPGVYSKSEIDAARLKELQARDALQTEKDQLELLQASRKRLESVIDLGLAQLDKAKLDQTRTEIRAPISGIVTAEGPEEGGYLQRGGTTVVIQDTSLMEIRCSLPMRQMSWLWPANQSEEELPPPANAYELPETPATVHFDMGAATCEWKGRLAYFDGGRVDQQTRMVPCRVIVDRPKNVELVGEAKAALQSSPITLLAGMFVTVEIHANPGIELLSLPEQAVQPGNQVWTVRPVAQPDDEEVEKAPWELCQEQLNVAHTTDGTVLAYPHGSDLKVGDKVVVSPLASPTVGTLVEIMESK